jgi:replicative DNA helicase
MTYTDLPGANMEEMRPATGNREYTATCYTLPDLLGAWTLDAEEAYQLKQAGKARGPVTGLYHLNKAIGGALFPGLHVIHGTPGTGKTAFALQIGAKCDCPCIYVTCEMLPIELLRRITARVTEKYLGKFRTGELSPAESVELASIAIEKTPNLSIFDATRSRVTCEEIKQEAAKRINNNQPYLLIIIDSLHSWADTTYDQLPTEYERLNTALADLRKMALTINCAVLLIAERSRAANEGGLSAGAGSRKIEYGSETVIELEREKVKDESGKTIDAEFDPFTNEVPIIVKISKNRNGIPGGKVKVTFNGAFQLFTETDKVC